MALLHSASAPRAQKFVAGATRRSNVATHLLKSVLQRRVRGQDQQRARGAMRRGAQLGELERRKDRACAVQQRRIREESELAGSQRDRLCVGAQVGQEVCGPDLGCAAAELWFEKALDRRHDVRCAHPLGMCNCSSAMPARISCDFVHRSERRKGASMPSRLASKVPWPLHERMAGRCTPCPAARVSRSRPSSRAGPHRLRRSAPCSGGGHRSRAPGAAAARRARMSRARHRALGRAAAGTKRDVMVQVAASGTARASPGGGPTCWGRARQARTRGLMSSRTTLRMHG